MVIASLLLINIFKQAHVNEIKEKGTRIPNQNIYDKLNSVKWKETSKPK